MKFARLASFSNPARLVAPARRPLFILTFLFVALKLWLVAAQPVVAHANASFDDRLFLALAEQIILCRLSVFAGPFGIEALRAVCCDREVPEASAEVLLGGLVDKSLVVVELL